MSVSGTPYEVRELTAEQLAELDLIQLLELQQRLDAISGAELSRRIGVDQATWSRARRGIDRLGADTCAKVVEAYPHLRAPAARYLTGSFPSATLGLLEDAARIVRGAA